jgi:hypothetical protein
LARVSLIFHGRQTAVMIAAEIAKRRVVAPSAPMLGNKLLAKDAPLCTETMAISIMPMGRKREAATRGKGIRPFIRLLARCPPRLARRRSGLADGDDAALTDDGLGRWRCLIGRSPPVNPARV